jgi:periplasmic protein TonB
MDSFFHAINIGTLATWLSVAGLGAVAGVFDRGPLRNPPPKQLEALPVSQDFTLGDDMAASDSPSESPPEADDHSTPVLPAPPELPDIAEFEPLPEIPDLPAPKPAESTAPAVTKAATQPAVTNKPATPRRSKANASSSSAGTSSAKPNGGGGGMSDSSRLAAGRMPAPSYPPFARRNGQTGTVLVEFTVDATGRVISAYAKSSSSWPLLDNEAVRTVRSWKFPAGGVMKLQRPIVFRLN